MVKMLLWPLQSFIVTKEKKTVCLLKMKKQQNHCGIFPYQNVHFCGNIK